MTAKGVSWRSEKVRRERVEVEHFAQHLEEELARERDSADSRLIDFVIGGSWRRGAAEIGDFDVLLITADGSLDEVMLPMGFRADRAGDRIAMGDLTTQPAGPETQDTVHVDFWGCAPHEAGAMLWFITGPKELNVAMRTLALGKGMSLSQYGLLDKETQEQLDDGTEENIAELLGLPTSWATTPACREYMKLSGKTESLVMSRATKAIQHVSVKGSTGNDYLLTVEHGSAISCSCKGFTYRQHCRHVDSYNADGE